MNCQLRCALVVSFCLLPAMLWASQNASEEPIRAALTAHAVPLRGGGEALLISEARLHDFFLLGELHGETEIPALLSDLWPQLWQAGYRHVAAEISPWAAEHLERPARPENPPIKAL